MDRGEAQLFIDDEVIESHTRVHRAIHQPQRFGPDPILRPERPWEGNCICLYGTVLRSPDTGLYHIYYQTFNKVAPPENTYICCATSADGLNWEKPELGEVPYRGSRRNNIILAGFHGGVDSPSVILDPGEPDARRRYKLLTYGRGPDGRGGLYAAFSADGLHWQALPEPVVPSVGDRTNVMLDPGKPRPYVAYTRRHTMMQDHARRTVYRSDSADFLEWSDPRLALAPDLADHYDIQFYGFSAFRYESIYVGLIQVLHSQEDVQDLQLAVSRDNVTWRRVEPRQVFFPRGRRDGWEGAWVCVASNPPLERDGRLWFYYEGRTESHGQAWPFPRGAIGVAVLRRDGFASLDAGPVEAHVTTRPFAWPGGRLLVNLDCKAAVGATEGAQQVGFARLEVLDDAGNPVPGFTRDECETFRGDALDHEFAWPGTTLDALKGKAIRLRFWLVNASLYGFRVA